MADHGWAAVAARIRRDRVSAGYATQAEFAARCGISRGTVSSLERGKRSEYRSETLAAVEAALGWAPGSIEAVRKGRPPRRADDEQLAQLLGLWPMLGTKERAALVAVARALR